MKGKILGLTLSLLILACGTLSAQETSTKSTLEKVRFGFKICPNFSSLKTVSSATDEGYETEKFGSVTGFGFGMIADVAISENYYLAMGLNIITGGGGVSVNSTNDNNRTALEMKSGDVKYKMQYVEFPFGIKMYNDINSDMKIYADIGLQLALTIGKTAQYGNIELYDGTVYGGTSDYEKITGLSVTPTAFGMNLGAGITYNINNNLDGLFGIRFTNYFLPDITLPQKGMLYSKAGGQEITFDDGKQRLNGIQINFGLMF